LYAEGERVLEQATLDAVAGRNERTEAQAWSQLVQVRAELHHFDAARDAAAHAYACIDRLGDDPVRAKLLVNEATVHEYEGDYEGQVKLLERSRDLRERLYGEG